MNALPLSMRLKRLFFGLLRPLKTPRMVWGWRGADGVMRPRTRISDTAYFNHPKRLNIADNVFIGHFTILDATGGLDIGPGAQIAGLSAIYTHSSHLAIRRLKDRYQEVAEAEKPGFIIKGVRIGAYAFIGAGAMIFPGVTIGDEAMVMAGSVVTLDVPAGKVAGGAPARVLGDVENMYPVPTEDAT